MLSRPWGYLGKYDAVLLSGRPPSLVGERGEQTILKGVVHIQDTDIQKKMQLGQRKSSWPSQERGSCDQKFSGGRWHRS